MTTRFAVQQIKIAALGSLLARTVVDETEPMTWADATDTLRGLRAEFPSEHFVIMRQTS